MVVFIVGFGYLDLLIVAIGACFDQTFSAICSASLTLFYPIIHVK
jgi:hypothetical protein